MGFRQNKEFVKHKMKFSRQRQQFRDRKATHKVIDTSGSIGEYQSGRVS